LAAQGQVLNDKGLLAAKQEAQKAKQAQDDSRHDATILARTGRPHGPDQVSANDRRFPEAVMNDNVLYHSRLGPDIFSVAVPARAKSGSQATRSKANVNGASARERLSIATIKHHSTLIHR